jgi:hypothetical protein
MLALQGKDVPATRIPCPWERLSLARTLHRQNQGQYFKFEINARGSRASKGRVRYAARESAVPDVPQADFRPRKGPNCGKLRDDAQK